jgi:DHA2 family multidrug resistance protein-like MFS transporter
MAVAAMPNLFFYTTLLLQYRYGASLIAIAIFLILTQASAAAGGLLSGPVSARIGPAQAAAVGLFVCGVLRFAPTLVTSSSPIWVPVVVLAISSAPAAFLIGPITNTMLSRAPKDDSGVGASMNKSTWTLGSVLGGALIGALTFSAFQSRLADVLTVDGLPLPEAQIIAEEIRNGAAVAKVAVNITEPIARSDLLSQGLALVSAQTHAYAVMGLISATITLIATVIMVLYLRRVRRTATCGRRGSTVRGGLRDGHCCAR